MNNMSIPIVTASTDLANLGQLRPFFQLNTYNNENIKIEPISLSGWVGLNGN